MSFRTFIIAAISALICSFRAYATPVSNTYEIINTDYAIGKSCQCAFRDHYGFLWIGTASDLYAYDSGGRMLYPSSDMTVPPLSDVKALFELDGNIWAGVSNGLWVYDRQKNTTTRFPVKTKYGVTVSSPVQRIMKVAEGQIWILTYGQGFFIFNTKDNTLEQNSRNGAFYSDMAVGTNGNIYAVSLDGELKVFNSSGGLIDSIILPEFTAGHNSLRMTADASDIMVSSGKTIYNYNPQNKILTHEQPTGLTSDIKSMCAAPEGIVLGTDKGLWLYDKSLHSASNFASTKNTMFAGHLSDDHVNFVMSDTDNSMLILTTVGGVSHLTLHKQPIGLIELGTDNTPVAATAICLSADGNHVWTGSNKGLGFLDTSTLTTRHLDIPGLAGDNITSIAANGDTLWIGTESRGVFRHNTATHETRHYVYNANIPNSLISNTISKIFISSRNEVYILSDWGLCQYIDTYDNFNTRPEIDSHKQPLTMAEDRHGKIWLTMADGSIFMREPDNASFGLFMSKSLRGKSTAILKCDYEGELLAAANDNRIYVFDESENDFVPYSFGVPNDYPLTFMERDRDGKLWLGDASGALAAIASKRMEFFVYKANSYADIFTMTDISAFLADGRIVYGDENGLRIFNPRELKPSGAKVSTYVHSIQFPYISDGVGEQRRLGIEGSLCDCDTLTLPYGDNTFSLMLTTSHACDMPPVRFRYRLDGYDKEWMTTSEPTVTYTNLPPDTYKLRLHSETEPEDSAKTLVITIAPPWYRTLTAFILYAILAVILGWILWIAIRYRVRKHYHKRINDMRLQKERETFEAKMQFFVNLVHEIRTPLTLISLPLEQMAENARAGKTKTEDNKKHIKSMRRNVNYLLGIVNQLLDFRKAQSGSEIQLKRTRTDINKLITDIAERFEHPMATANKTFRLIMPPVDIHADVDVDKIDRVVMNIVSNAMKYSRSTVTLELCAPEDGEFAIKVSDDGTGVPKDERQRIFDTYYQISGDDVAATLGTGLGLAYAKLIANAHKGSITVDNNASGGATFTITLNAATATASQQEKKPEIIGESEEETSEEHRDITVLLVDDNAELLATVSESLSQNYTVFTATSGEDALAELNKNSNIDFIISDFMMPGMSGARLCQRVKNDIRFSHIPFIMLTAKTDREAKEEGMEAGVDVYVEKPFTIKQLKLQIANMIKARATFYRRMISAQPQLETIESGPYINRLDTEFLSTLNENISENISDEEFSIDTMAERMNMSRSSFYRKLKAITGMTPVDYLKNYRLEHATKLLLEGARITEVALMSGFTSASYFSKCFKAKYGQNPKEYATAKQSGMSQNG